MESSWDSSTPGSDPYWKFFNFQSWPRNSQSNRSAAIEELGDKVTRQQEENERLQGQVTNLLMAVPRWLLLFNCMSVVIPVDTLFLCVSVCFSSSRVFLLRWQIRL